MDEPSCPTCRLCGKASGWLMADALARPDVLIAVLSNPLAHGNKSELHRIRNYCSAHPGITHDEVARDKIGETLERVLASGPRVLAINGGDGTVQAVLSELYRLGRLSRDLPPLAVLPNGTTNLIAKDSGSAGDSVRALARCHEIAKNDLAAHLIERQLICMSDDSGSTLPVIGLFLGAGGLADIILHCRHHIYPIGLPPSVSHALSVLASLLSILTNWNARFLPPPPALVKISNEAGERLNGNFQVVMVTTLHQLVLTGTTPLAERGKHRVLAIDRRRGTGLRIVVETLIGRLGRSKITGVHWMTGKELRIEAGYVILDGEVFEASQGHPIVLRPIPPVKFVELSS